MHVRRSSYLKPYFLYPEALVYQVAIGFIHLSRVREDLTYGAKDTLSGPNIMVVELVSVGGFRIRDYIDSYLQSVAIT